MKRFINFFLSFVFLTYLVGGFSFCGKPIFSYIADLLRVSAILVGMLLIADHFNYFEFKLGDLWIVKGFTDLSQSLKKRASPKTLLGRSALVISVLLILSFFLLPLVRHWGFGSWYWDLGVMEQVIWREAHGYGLTSTAILDRAEPALEFLKNGHLNFWLYPTALIYSWIPRTELLLLMQSLALVLSFIPLWKIATNLLPSQIAPILLIILYWCWDPIHRINIWDIHEMAYLPVLSLWAYAFFLEKRFLAVSICLVAVGMFKEDAWIISGSMAFYFFATKKKWMSAGVAFFAGFIVYVAYGVFFNKVNLLSDRYSYLGARFSDSIPIILHDPLIFLKALLQPMSLRFLGRLLLSGGGLWLFSGLAMIPMIPTFLECALSTSQGMPNFNSHYVVALGGPLLFATAVGASRIFKVFKNEKQAFLIVSLLSLVGIAQLYVGEPAKIRETMQTEIWKNRTCFSRLISKIPQNAALYTLDPLTTHLSQRPILLAYRPDKTFDQAGAWITMPSKDLTPKGFKLESEECGFKIVSQSNH